MSSEDSRNQRSNYLFDEVALRIRDTRITDAPLKSHLEIDSSGRQAANEAANENSRRKNEVYYSCYVSLTSVFMSWASVIAGALCWSKAQFIISTHILIYQSALLNDVVSIQWRSETNGCPGPIPIKLINWMPPATHHSLSLKTLSIGSPPANRDAMKTRGRPLLQATVTFSVLFIFHGTQFWLGRPGNRIHFK